jgi:hypothetical protein
MKRKAPNPAGTENGAKSARGVSRNADVTITLSASLQEKGSQNDVREMQA